MFEHRANGRDEPDLFGDEKQAKRALDGDIQGVGTLPGCQIIHDDHGTPNSLVDDG